MDSVYLDTAVSTAMKELEVSFQRPSTEAQKCVPMRGVTSNT